ncbi:MAG: hypothetical protein JNN29_14100 [Chitinophagaceae bacterium]|nr:hypothetical protein [Chitinophagaceae bacterium]
MSQIGKSSLKRGKPSYFMAIIGVAIVLFLIGIFGWLFLSGSRYMKHLKEEIRIAVLLQNNARQADIDSMVAQLKSRSFTRNVAYIDKETAKKQWMNDGGDDFNKLIDENPLPASIEFNVSSEYVNKDSLINLKNELSKNLLLVQSVEYPAALVEKMGPAMKLILIGLIILSSLFAILSIILIDNTIRLAMYSNRFLIKTMQMVGATRSFISKPMNIQAVINGTIAALIAIGAIIGLIYLFEWMVPDLRLLRDNGKLTLLFIILILTGIGISVLSTFRSITKYLRMKLDDLY